MSAHRTAWTLIRHRRVLALTSSSLWLALGWAALTANADPILNLQRGAGDNVQLSWPSLDRNWVLQTTPTLTDSASWETVPHSPSLAGPNFSLSLTLPPGSKISFFRLLQQSTSGALGGLNFLYDSQNDSGYWGAGSGAELRATAAAIDALKSFGRDDVTVTNGLAALAGLTPRNNDELSRRTIALAAASQNVSNGVIELLAAGNLETTDPASLDYPGGGWGLAPGFGNSTIDTALALRALATAGKVGGLAIVKEALAGSAASPARPFVVPAGATGLRLVARQRSVPVRYTITYPSGGGSSFVNVAAGTSPTTINFPIGTGTLTLTVLNQSAGAGTHSAEVAFIRSDGFDVGRVTTALAWLGAAQNGDGGWSLLSGEASHLMITSEVMRALGACGGSFAPGSVLSTASAWMLARQNADGGFSSLPPTSNLQESSLALLALRAAQTTNSLATAAAYLRAAQLYNGSWNEDPLQTALAAQALLLPPVVSAVPGQTVTSPAAFASINLDGFVADPDHTDSQIAWTVTGHTLLNVSIVNRVATISYTAGSNITEQLIFTATDPDGYSASASATFSVVFQSVDYTIARGGSVSGSRIFTAASSLLDQVAFYTESPNGVPSGGLSYASTGVGRISATEMQVNFQISASPTATTGIRNFQVTYGLLDSNSQPLTPLSGNVFNFSIQVNP